MDIDIWNPETKVYQVARIKSIEYTNGFIELTAETLNERFRITVEGAQINVTDIRDTNKTS